MSDSLKSICDLFNPNQLVSSSTVLIANILINIQMLVSFINDTSDHCHSHSVRQAELQKLMRTYFYLMSTSEGAEMVRLTSRICIRTFSLITHWNSGFTAVTSFLFKEQILFLSSKITLGFSHIFTFIGPWLHSLISGFCSRMATPVCLQPFNTGWFLYISLSSCWLLPTCVLTCVKTKISMVVPRVRTELCQKCLWLLK